jgi:hypothetical protein
MRDRLMGEREMNAPRRYRQTRLISSTFVALSLSLMSRASERARSKKSVSLLWLFLLKAAGTGVFENADGVNSQDERRRTLQWKKSGNIF